jgi:hypothetical protein
MLQELWVIEGNHRLEKRYRDCCTETQAILVLPNILEPRITSLW